MDSGQKYEKKSQQQMKEIMSGARVVQNRKLMVERLSGIRLLFTSSSSSSSTSTSTGTIATTTFGYSLKYHGHTNATDLDINGSIGIAFSLSIDGNASYTF
ncbi:unnamed protein product, partial [Ceratitis capitata]